MTRHGDGFLADAFHEATVADKGVGFMLDQIRAEHGVQVAFGNRHADGIGDALAQGAGGCFNACGMAEFRVACGFGTPLAEIADFFHRHVGIAGEMEQGVDQHGTVAGGQDEAVAVGPMRGFGVEFQESGKQHGGDVGGPQGKAGVAGIGLLDRIHRKGADGIGHLDLRRGVRHRAVSHGKVRSSQKNGLRHSTELC